MIIKLNESVFLGGNMEEKLPPLFVSIFKRRGIAYRKIGETFEKILSNLSEDEISSIEDIQRVL